MDGIEEIKLVETVRLFSPPYLEPDAKPVPILPKAVTRYSREIFPQGFPQISPGEVYVYGGGKGIFPFWGNEPRKPFPDEVCQSVGPAINKGNIEKAVLVGDARFGRKPSVVVWLKRQVFLIAYGQKKAHCKKVEGQVCGGLG